MYRSFQLVHIIRRLINRYPKLVWLLADMIRRWPWLEQYLTRRYAIRLPKRHIAEPLAGYRFPLANTPDQLTDTARAILKKIEE